MLDAKDIVVVIDYHAENIEFRHFDQATGEERTGKYATTRTNLLRQLEQLTRELPPGGRVVWIMESTTGWARVRELLAGQVHFILANVLQMPLPPKGKRRKSDRIDTARLLREYLCGTLPEAFQPAVWWREVRRVVDCRQDLVERQTAIKNWLSSLLHHETWEDRTNLWSQKGQRRLAAMPLSASDRQLVELKLAQLRQLDEQRQQLEQRMHELYEAWPEAQWVDEIRGIGLVSAVSLLAHIGPIERFPTAEDLISYAGLAPGTRQSDSTCHHGKLGGGGTDGHLRYLAIEATTWLCQIPRYRPTYLRVLKKRGKKIARIVVARLLLRSLHKMLRDRVPFNAYDARVNRPPSAVCAKNGGAAPEPPPGAQPLDPGFFPSGDNGEATSDHLNPALVATGT
jgi:transposase